MDLSILNIKRKFFGLWEKPDDLGEGVAKGGALLIFERILIRGLLFIKTIILARILFPDDFGLFGMATLTLSVADLLFQPGMASAIVQERENIKKYLDNAWTTNVIRGLILGLLLFFLGAPLAGKFFHNEMVVPLARALSLSFFMGGFLNIGTSLLQKEMRFNRIFFYDVIYVVINVCALIAAALVLRNAWALILGMLVAQLADVILSYVFHPYRPKLSFDFKRARYLFGFGKWIWFSGIIGFLVGQGDNLTVGKMLNSNDLGLYSVAFALATLPAVEIAKALGSVLFPFYSKIQNDHLRLREAFIRIARVIFFIAIPASFGLLALAPEAVSFIYSPKWLAMVPALYVLIIYGFFKCVEFLLGPLFLGAGRPKVVTVVSIVQAVVMFSLIVPLIKNFGLIGSAYAVLAGIFAAQSFSFFMLKKTIDFGVFKFLKIIFLPLVCSGLMCGAVVLVKKFFPVVNIYFFVVYIFFGIVVYFSLAFLLDKIFGRHYWHALIWIKENI